MISRDRRTKSLSAKPAEAAPCEASLWDMPPALLGVGAQPADLRKGSKAAGQFDQIVRAALRAGVAGQEPRPGTRDAILARAAADRDRSIEGAQAALDVPRLAGYRRNAIPETYAGWNVQVVTGDLDTRLWLLDDHLRKRLSTA